jgi:insecticidal toxin complex protein TccC
MGLGIWHRSKTNHYYHLFLLHIGTHIFSESSKDSTQNHTRYQLTSHLQSNTLELDDKAQTLSYEHYYPYV